jgi:hypothetical protein
MPLDNTGLIRHQEGVRRTAECYSERDTETQTGPVKSIVLGG